MHTMMDRVARWMAGAPAPSAAVEVATLQPYRDAIIVIDVSASMDETDYEPTRLAAAQASARTYVERLEQEEPEATVSIVTFSNYGHIACPPTRVGDSVPILNAIDELETIYSTNLTAGLCKALDILKQLGSNNGQVIVLSDGHHNGPRRPRRVAEKLRNRGIVECVGIGGSPMDVDEKLLRVVASSKPDGGKRYRWIGDREQLVQHYRQLAGRITR